MGVVTDLGSLLNTKADKNYYTQQLMFWTAKYEANQEKLEKQVKYENKYLDASEAAIGNTRELKAPHVTVHEDNKDKDTAERYAHAKVDLYDEELSEELAELDVEYDTMKTMYETLIASLEAQEESEKSLTQQDAADTNMLQG